MHTPRQPPLTELLQRSADGDKQAQDAAWSHIHDQLRAVARVRLQREAAPECQPTELVHEAFLKLDGLTLAPRDRSHFLALAARAMRQVLVDQARARRAEKRGGGQPALTLKTNWIDHNAPAEQQACDVLDLHEAINHLATMDERKAEAVVLSYFGGLTDSEVADALAVSEPTVKRDLRTARAWLASTLAA